VGIITVNVESFTSVFILEHFVAYFDYLFEGVMFLLQFVAWFVCLSAEHFRLMDGFSQTFWTV